MDDLDKKRLQAIRRRIIKCKSLTEFRKKYVADGCWLRSRGLYKEEVSTLPTYRELAREKNIKRARKSISKCKTLQEFREKYNKDHEMCEYYKILKQETKHLLKNKDIQLIKEQKNLTEYFKLVKKCKSRVELLKDHYKIYIYLQRRNKLDEAFKHLPKRTDKYDSAWYIERCAEIEKIGKKYKYKKDFIKGDRKIYQYAIKKGLLKTLCAHLSIEKPPQVINKNFLKLNKEERIIEARKLAKKCKRRGEFQIRYRSAYHVVYKAGLLDDICKHMPEKHQEIKWTKEKLIKEAAKYGSRGDFQKGSCSAYNVSHTRGILDEVCPHMAKPNNHWVKKEITYDKIKNLSLKYNVWSNFVRENMGAFYALRRHKRYYELKEVHKKFHGNRSEQ